MTSATLVPRRSATVNTTTARLQEVRALRDWRRRLGDPRPAVLAVVAVGALLALASPAAALRRIGPPGTSWSVSEIDQGAGRKLLGHDTPRGGNVFDLGPNAFDFGLEAVKGRASAAASLDPVRLPILWVQAPVLNPHVPRSAKGGVAHIEMRQAFEKDVRTGASLRFQIGDIRLETDDGNVPLTRAECPGAADCHPIHAIVRYHARADLASKGRCTGSPPTTTPFFDVGGAVYTEGYRHHWFVGAATSSDSRAPFWKDAAFKLEGDVVEDDLDERGTGRHSRTELREPITLNVPLSRLCFGQRFTVHVNADVEAIDDRGFESGAQVFMVNFSPLIGFSPQPAVAQLTARGLAARRAPAVKEPRIPPQPLARCPGGPRRHAGRLQLSRPAFAVGEASGSPLALVTRTGGSRGAATVTLRTRGGTARSGEDFKRTRTRIRFENGDTSPRLVDVPIREDLTQESPERFTVSLAHARCATLGKRHTASVTILDDDQPPPPPPPVFTIGGTVDGLQGSGLVLTDFGEELAVSANGSFTLPVSHRTDELYDVTVKTQPRNPDQLCSVNNGKGHVGGANVTDIVVHCATVAPPTGLDPTFGGDGRVTVPGVGDAQAVLIEPDGHIVTVGSRGTGAVVHFDFGATRHDAAGNLDPSFGTGGIATTDLGGDDDHAFDATLLPDGGFVAVGQADPAGLGNTDFGLVRYTPDGHPDPAFGTRGIVTDDLTGRNEGANAVAVQPADGKILAAGFAQLAPSISDFALVRYNPDGTRDTTFGFFGVVTTDFGTDTDAATDIALQPDGKIVVVGATAQNHTIFLARYNPDGTPDLTFNGIGTLVSDIGTNIVNGVAIAPDGSILVAGTRGGPHGLDPIVASYAPSGKINSGFGQAGVAQADLSDGGNDFGEDVTLDAQGNIVVVGSAASATVTDMALVRFKPDGTLDTAFNGQGFLTADVTGFGESGNALTIDPAGRIVAAGTSGGFELIRANP